jgi:hypothetical protein
MSNPLPYRRRPCAQCPWRRDVEPGQFPAERYEALAATSGKRSAEAGITAPMFACHKSPERREEACAGWLAAVGWNHLGVRVAVHLGRLPECALTPGEDWPELFTDYEDMAATQAGEGDR